MIRFISAAPIVAVALAVAPVAFAKDIQEKHSFTKANGTTVVSQTNFHTKTGVTDIAVTKTNAEKQVRTVSERISPDHKGGFKVTKTVKGFNATTPTTTHSSIGPGSHSQASSGAGSQGGSRGGHGRA